MKGEPFAEEKKDETLAKILEREKGKEGTGKLTATARWS